jgi:hypothetical protein
LHRIIEQADANVVIAASQVGLARLLGSTKPILRARYHFEGVELPGAEAPTSQAGRGRPRQHFEPSTLTDRFH